MKSIEEYVRSIPDFPEPGIIFRDVTSVLQDADGLHLAIDLIQKKLEGVDFDLVVGPESRGFIFGVPIAYNLHKPFIPIRKKGKLPCETVSIQYDLEYGTAELEMHRDSVKPGQRVVIIDDLIATGGTNEAMIKLARKYSFDKYGPGRGTVITLKNSFHGRTVTTLAATGQDVFHQYFFPFTEGFRHAAPSLDGVQEVAGHDVCAVLVELVQG